MKKKKLEEEIEIQLKKGLKYAKEGDASVMEASLNLAQRYADKEGIDISDRIKEIEAIAKSKND